MKNAEVKLTVELTIWPTPTMAAKSPWEWEVRCDGRSTEGRCATRAEAIDRLLRHVEQEVRSA